MGEEADDGELGRLAGGVAGGEGDDAGRVLEWEIGLPSADDLTPLSQSLIPPGLASAFSISPEPLRTILDVHRASQNTVSHLRCLVPSSSSAAALRSFHLFPSPASNPAAAADDPMVIEGDDDSSAAKDVGGEFSHKAWRPADDGDSAARGEENSADDSSARTLKRPRLVWTPQLHKRFVDVVAHLGIKNAVPKTIMQLMNVDGLTRENVASHLQKYRLYLKRMQGLSNEGLSSSDPLFASTPVPQNLQEQPVPVPVPYAMPPMIPMPVYGTPHPHGHGRGMGMVPVNNHQGNGIFHGFESHHPFGGHTVGSIVSYPQMTSNDKQ